MASKTRGAASLKAILNPQRPEGVPLTQAELARRLGVSQQAVSNWVNGYSTPSLEYAAEIERIYAIPAREWTEDAADNDAAPEVA